MLTLYGINICYYFYILWSHFSQVILTTEEVITAIFKVISATTKVILVTEEVIIATLTLYPPNYAIWIFTHLKLCLADAIHNFKWVKIIQIWQNGGQLLSNIAD